MWFGWIYFACRLIEAVDTRCLPGSSRCQGILTVSKQRALWRHSMESRGKFWLVSAICQYGFLKHVRVHATKVWVVDRDTPTFLRSFVLSCNSRVFSLVIPAPSGTHQSTTILEWSRAVETIWRALGQCFEKTFAQIRLWSRHWLLY